MSAITCVSQDGFTSDASSNNVPPVMPSTRAPTALASPFHPGTTLGSSSNAKVDRFQDVRNLFAKRSLRKQDSGRGVEMGVRKCLCEKELEDEDDIYCSSACARLDAMSSLCFAENQRLAAAHNTQSSISSLSSITSSSISGRSVSTSSVTSSNHPRTASDVRLSPSQASHYRRMTSEEVKRRAGHSRNTSQSSHSSRRRQRPDGSTSASGTSIGSIASVISSGFARVPELVGGHPYTYTTSHSRNPSAASSGLAFPLGSSSSSLSRNPSLASTHSWNGSLLSNHSARGAAVFAEMTLMGSALPEHGGLTNVREEAEDEIERLADAEDDDSTTPERRTVGQAASPPRTHLLTTTPLELEPSFDQINAAISGRAQDPFGMGRDMQDVLDEIILMEQGFRITSSESEHETDGEGDLVKHAGGRRISQQRLLGAVAPGRPRTPPLGLEASRRRSTELPAAPQRSSHHSNDYTCIPTPSQPLGPSVDMKSSRRSRYSRHVPSQSEPFLETFNTNKASFGYSSVQLPSAFEDAMEEEDGTDLSGEQENMNRPSLAGGRRSFTRRSRSEIRRSLTFIPPSGYRASLLTSIQETNTPKSSGLRTPLAINTLAKRRNSMSVSATASDARMSAHPYRRSVLRGVEDSVTRFQFPKMATGDTNSRQPLTIDTALEALEEVPALLTPLQLRSAEIAPLSAEPMDVNTPVASEFPQATTAEIAIPLPECLAPSLFPASPVAQIAVSDHATTTVSVPSSGLRLGVLLGSGDEDDWLRQAEAVDDDDEDDSMDIEYGRA
ncbi:hypothetical protein QFC22_004622 [Naganishia vaughanmartiniae]|uniref:Uncharacterized protein n=1 Tax=Naganishia vaughanmartiniae TaxID=1424756 RepID=A0ACC2WYT2_9TREE|nr:hypothetical protein QFC22_004622 [Naganishia vaughanmartiniae]